MVILAKLFFLAFAFGFSTFAFSNIIYPLFITLPCVFRLQRQISQISSQKYNHPKLRYLIAPIVWTLLLSIFFIIISNLLSYYTMYVIAGMALGLFGVLIKLFTSPQEIVLEAMESVNRNAENDESDLPTS